ncbi:MAG: hypothetical protein MHM6MM_000096 [Cercozoa sp. M6MM]
MKEICDNLTTCTVSIAQMKQTGVGKTVKKVMTTAGSDGELREVSSRLLSKWRAQAKQAREKAAAASKKTSAAAPQTAKFDAGSVKRNRVMERFAQALGGEEHMRAAFEIEKCLYAVCGSDENDSSYLTKFRELKFNLGDSSNPRLRQRVLSGELSAADLVAADTASLASEEMQEKRRKAIDFIMEEQSGDRTTDVAATDEFKCGKCGSRKCSYKQAQTRSADEPMTTFVTCMNCKNRWKC